MLSYRSPIQHSSMSQICRLTLEDLPSNCNAATSFNPDEEEQRQQDSE